MKTKKFYVVWKGRTPGIYNSWPECKEQIDFYEGAVYKSYESMQEAAIAFTKAPGLRRSSSQKTMVPKSNKPIPGAYCVDAACSGNPGVMEYQCALLDTREIIFRSKKYAVGTNNIGEFLAIVHCLAKLQKEGKGNHIYSDSYNAILWVKHKKCKTKLPVSPETRELHEVIKRAEKWLATATYTNKILKWETEIWGEIPADFGRK
ncbi:MAG: ribonuclease H family protein [Ignavibacteriales bacterium]|nr:ribonuclease H family protein [Ignavibacteriales bacterium]